MVALVDVTDMRNSVFRNVAGTNCGATGSKLCAQFDHSGVGLLIDPTDVALLRGRAFTTNGPTCASCAGPFSEPLQSGKATLARPIQCGSRATSACP